MSEFFLFYPFTEGVTLQKFYALHGGFNSNSPLVQAQGLVSSSDAAVQTQTSGLLGLANAPRQLQYQSQLTALVFSFLLFSSPGDLLLSNKVSNTLKMKFITLDLAFLTTLSWEIFQTL